MRTSTRMLAHAVSRSPSYDVALQELQNPALFCMPVTPEIWLKEAGDFAHWVNSHLHRSEDLHACPLCSLVFFDQAELTEHLHRQSSYFTESPFEDLNFCPRSAAAPLPSQAPYWGLALRLNRVPHLARLTEAHISKLIPGKYEHRYKPIFRCLLNWANLTRGALLAQYTQAMGLCRYLKQASLKLPPDLLAASADVLSSTLSHSWHTMCRDILALKRPLLTTDTTVTALDVLGFQTVSSSTWNPFSTEKAEPVGIALHEHDGAIYCRFCAMWLNGPTQWADHENGKKHRKAVQRMQVQLQLQPSHP